MCAFGDNWYKFLKFVLLSYRCCASRSVSVAAVDRSWAVCLDHCINFLGFSVHNFLLPSKSVTNFRRKTLFRSVRDDIKGEIRT